MSLLQVTRALRNGDRTHAVVCAARAALAGLKGSPRAAMASVPKLATATRSAEYLAMDTRLAAR